MADIFLSYAREDVTPARLLAAALESRGWSVWWDRQLPPGQDFEAHIQRQLDGALCIVVLWSAASLASKFVRDEAAEGLDGRLVPVLLEPVKQPLGFRQLQAADLSDWRDQPGHAEFDRLVASISDVLAPLVQPHEIMNPAAVARPAMPPGRRVWPLLAGIVVALATILAAIIYLREPAAPDGNRDVAADTSVGRAPLEYRPAAWGLPDEELLGFVAIPPGTFVMGSDTARDRVADTDEVPPQQVTTAGFFIARYEVTIGQYSACVAAGGCKAGEPETLEGPENWPVRHVSWHEALAYASWLESMLKASKDTPEALAAVLAGRPGANAWHVTLPTEAQWERAARGTDGRIRPWGDPIDPTRANYADTRRSDPTPVGTFPAGASPYGLLDMCGNVWEWTRSQYLPYPYADNDGRENMGAGDDAPRSLRGGSFYNTAEYVRAADRYMSMPSLRHDDVGFRVAISQ